MYRVLSAILFTKKEQTLFPDNLSWLKTNKFFISILQNFICVKYRLLRGYFIPHFKNNLSWLNLINPFYWLARLFHVENRNSVKPLFFFLLINNVDIISYFGNKCLTHKLSFDGPLHLFVITIITVLFLQAKWRYIQKYNTLLKWELEWYDQLMFPTSTEDWKLHATI